MAAGRVGADNLDVGFHRVQEARQSHQSAGRADGTHQIVDLPLGLLPYLDGRILVVCKIVGGIGKLVGHVVFVGVLGYHASRKAYGAVGTLIGWCQYNHGPVRTEYLAPLDRDGGAHYDLDRITQNNACDGETDTRISRCGLDDGLARGELPALDRGLDHTYGNAVLDAARGVESFEFGVYVDTRIGAQGVDSNHRG